MPQSLYLIRHAPVIAPRDEVYGDMATIDLPSQAQALAALAARLPAGDTVLWGHSGVVRARETGEAVRQLLQAQEAPFETWPGFREQNFGSLIGKKHEAVGDHVRFIEERIFAASPPGGEDIRSFIVRVGAAIDTARHKARAVGKSHIVVFCHGGTIRAAHVCLHRRGDGEFILLDTPPLFAYRHDFTADA